MRGISPLVVNQAGNSDPWGGKRVGVGRGWDFTAALSCCFGQKGLKLPALCFHLGKMPLLPLLPLRFGGIIMLPPHIPSPRPPPTVQHVSVLICAARVHAFTRLNLHESAG